MQPIDSSGTSARGSTAHLPLALATAQPPPQPRRGHLLERRHGISAESFASPAVRRRQIAAAPRTAQRCLLISGHLGSSRAISCRLARDLGCDLGCDLGRRSLFRADLAIMLSENLLFSAFVQGGRTGVSRRGRELAETERGWTMR